MQIVHLYISPEHNFFGHHGQPPGDAPMIEVDSAQCVAGKGIVGDRFFDHKEDYKGQITFFAEEIHEKLARQLGVKDASTSVFRRNVITRGIDLNTLIGREFEVQGVRFFGSEECKPCYWMDTAFAPGAEVAMKGNGGLRVRVLSDGVLRPDAS